ncbi:MAG TPA: hypothetical protein VEX66_07355 [Microlunatus sp.]|nr:hypothetical protein [Microlunatus sp.]
MALAVILTLGACRATGGGKIDDPVPSGVLPTGDINGSFTGEANFGFNFTCEMKIKNKAVIKGQITYHDTGSSKIGTEIGLKTFRPIRLHGVVDAVTLRAETCEAAAQVFLDAAQFDGTYRSQEAGLTSKPAGRFTVLVFDQGEPGVSRDPLFVTGDGFAIELVGGPYALYTRAGYIEGGNIQVDNT